MKIALISDALTVGGAERQLLLSAVELEKLGHHVEVIIYHPRVEFGHYIRQNGIRLVQISSDGFLHAARVLAMARYMKRARFDVVHAFKGFAPTSGSLAAHLAGTAPVFGGFRGLYEGTFLSNAVYRATDKLVAGWIVNSIAGAEAMSTRLGIRREKFSVVYNGIRPEMFRSDLTKRQAKGKLGLTEDRLVVTMIARMIPSKNHMLLLEAAGSVLRHHYHVVFMIVGDGPERRTLEEKAESLGVRQNVLFTGTREDIADLLAATDVSVLTSNSEGFPNALVEPMSVGIPVVTTDYTSARELVADDREGYVVPLNDAAALSLKIERLLQDPDLRSQMGMKGRETVRERFSAEAMAGNLLAVYRATDE